jgi:hypothetical protein
MEEAIEESVKKEIKLKNRSKLIYSDELDLKKNDFIQMK